MSISVCTLASGAYLGGILGFWKSPLKFEIVVLQHHPALAAQKIK